MNDPRPPRVRRPAPPPKRAPAELELPAGPPASALESQTFLRALEHVLSEEQRFKNWPARQGGPTMYGITQVFHDDFGDEREPISPSHPSPEETRRLYHALWNYLGARQRGPLTNAERLARFDTGTLYGQNAQSLLGLPVEEMMAERERREARPGQPAGYQPRTARLRQAMAAWAQP